MEKNAMSWDRIEHAATRSCAPKAEPKSSFPRWEATAFFCFAGSGWCGGFCVENVSFQKPGRKNSFGKTPEKLPNDRGKWAGLLGADKFSWKNSLQPISETYI
jgi:hypothetical protein